MEDSREKGPGIVWPPPPQTARVRYLGSLSSPGDVGVKASWVRRTINVVFGNEVNWQRMIRPYGVFADRDRVYVTDPGAGVFHVFDLTEKSYFMVSGAKGTRLVSPIGIAADVDGDIYVSDSVLGRVMVFNRKGAYLRDIGSMEFFTRPAGIALDNDRVYVVDTYRHEVLSFDKGEGTLLFRIGGKGISPGKFNFPTNIFVGKDGSLLITDSLNFRVQIFSRNGDVIDVFGRHGDGSGNFSKPKGIASDSEDHVYVADADFDIIQIFDREGRLLLGFGSSGRGPGEFVLPAGIHIDSEDRIYVADSYNGKVQMFQYIREKE